MRYDISVSDPWFDLIKTGRKKYEGRRYYFDVPKYKAGDILRIHRCINRKRTEDNFFVKIINIHKFNTFEEALNVFPIDFILPGITDTQEGINIYSKYVTLDTQLKDGVCLIEISVENGN